MKIRINVFYKLAISMIVLVSASGYSQTLSTIKSNDSYTFTLNSSAKTSAGVYSLDSTLVRTLWSIVNYDAGTYKIQWDGKDDNGKLMPAGKYFIKVVSNNVQYKWNGIIGNTSTKQTGSSVHRTGTSTYSMSGMAIVKGKAFFCSSYSEGVPSVASFLTSAPQERIDVYPSTANTKFNNGICSDGVRVYQDGYDSFVSDGTVHSWVSATLVSDNSAVIFSSGVNYKPVVAIQENAIDVLEVPNSMITGRAVQITGQYLFISRPALNRIDVINKITGAVIKVITTITNPKALCIDKNDMLWVSSGINTIAKYLVNANGTITPAGTSVNGVTDPGAMAVSPDNNKIAVIDYDTQQIKFFSNINGSADGNPVFGQSGGYVTNSTIANDKFCFKTANNLKDGYNGKLITYITFDTDGSFWVSDPGNYRNLHFSANRSFIETVTFQYATYSTTVDNANPKRVFGGWNEFSVDYSQQLTGNTGWAFTNNWGANISENYNQLEKFKSVHTFIYGGVSRTFAFIRKTSGGQYELAELQSNGLLRLTGIVKDNYIIDEQGRLTMGMKRYKFSGFDGSNNPIWDPAGEMLANITGITPSDPIYFEGFQQPAVTSTNKVIFYQSEAFTGGSRNNYVTGYHLGAIKKGDNKWTWLTQHGTNPKYYGNYPSPAYFDIGNNVYVYAGSQACVLDRNIVTGYHGEFWKLSQTNKYNHYLDNGLSVGQFGVTKQNVSGDAPEGMAGNAFTPQLIAGESSDVMYLFHGDENFHAGIHMWKITGLNSINERDIMIDFPNPSLSNDTLPGIDLLAGLPFQKVLSNGTAGWTRSNGEDTTKISSKWFTVSTGVKSYLSSALDLYTLYRQSAGVYKVERTLGNNNSLTSWSLKAKLSWDDNYPNPQDGSGGHYVEVLDNAGKIITRFYTQYTIPSGVFKRQVYGNDKMLVEDTEDNLMLITQAVQPFEISANNGLITFKYAGYSATTSKIIDAQANWSKPSTLRLYFWSTAGSPNNDRAIDLQAARFVKNKISQNISFDDIAPKRYGDAPFTLTASSSSQLPVNFTIVSGPAKIIGNTLSITGIGIVIIKASQDGDSVFDAAQSILKTFFITSGRIDL